MNTNGTSSYKVQAAKLSDAFDLYSSDDQAELIGAVLDFLGESVKIISQEGTLPKYSTNPETIAKGEAFQAFKADVIAGTWKPGRSVLSYLPTDTQA